jgi:hypothetical protein
MVAAWMRADTGVGPAMASGSHVWSGNWALLPMTAHRRAAAAATKEVRPMAPDRAASLMAAMSKVLPAATNRMEMPTRRPMSPVRVVRNALRAASELFFSSHQCPISMNEHRPIISQPNRSWRVLLAVTMMSMPAVNRLSAAK